MSLPDYFGKVALNAAHLLQHLDPTAFGEVLERRVIGLHFDRTAADRHEGRCLLDLVVRLLARLYPRLVIDGSAHADDLVKLARHINPNVTLLPTGTPEDVAIVVGEQVVEGPARVIYAGSDGWVARISLQRPVATGKTDNPFGAGVAACLAAANVFRVIFADSFPAGLDDDLDLSVLSLTRDGTGRGEGLGRIDLGEAHLAGVGAIGQAFVWALAGVPELAGSLDLVDDEHLDLGNLQRYVLAGRDQVGQAKAALAAEYLLQSHLTVRQREVGWGTHARQRDWKVERVAVALDSAEDRIAVQASLPRWLVNAWTQTGDLGVSRHDFLRGPCMACLYRPQATEKSRSMLIAESIGLANREREVRTLLALGTPLDEAWVADIAVATGVTLEHLRSYVGQPLAHLYSEAVCGGTILQAGGHHGLPRAAEVPLAFQSAMAGVLLAAELIIHAGQLRPHPLPAVTLMDLTRPLGTAFNQPRVKADHCLCSDQDYVTQYLHKHLNGSDPSTDPCT